MSKTTVSRFDLLKLMADVMCKGNEVIVLINGVLTGEVNFELHGEDSSKIKFKIIGQKEMHQELIAPETFTQPLTDYCKGSSLTLLCKGGGKLYVTFAYVTGALQEVSRLECKTETHVQEFFKQHHATQDAKEEKKVKLFGIF
jgi:hypothetical protein